MYQRKTYTRMPEREIRGGKIDVSREELADFQNKFGKNRTLRDLLNYDRTGKLPEAADDQRSRGRRAEAPKSSDDQRARGPQGANLLPDGGAGRGAPAEPSVVKTGAKSAEEKIRETTIRARAERAERDAMEARDKQRADREEQRRREDLMRPGRDAITPVLGPEMGLAGLGRAALGALGSRVTGMMTRRGESKEAQREAAEKARDEARERMRIDDEPKPSVFRSNRPPKDGIPTLREAVEDLPPVAPKDRVRVEGTKGGVYRSSKDEKPAEPRAEFRSRTADRMDERGMKRGGIIKSYAKGGSVKGSGCEQRGLRKCKVY